MIIDSLNREENIKKYYLILTAFVAVLIFQVKLNAEEPALNGYFWEKLDPTGRLVYVIAYTKGIGELNIEIRHQMDVLMVLYDMEKTEKNKYLAEYGKETKTYYEKNYHYFNIPYRQLVEGIDAIYQDYKNKTITLVDAFALVKADISGVDKTELQRRMSFMRLPEDEKERVIQNMDISSFLNSAGEPLKSK